MCACVEIKLAFSMLLISIIKWKTKISFLSPPSINRLFSRDVFFIIVCGLQMRIINWLEPANLIDNNHH